MLRLMRFTILLACVSGGCDRRASPSPNASTEPPSIGAASPAAKATSAPDARVSPATFSLPQHFVALGTEPFWAAEVDGQTMRYRTPEDQPGQLIAIVREARGLSIDLRGSLTGHPVVLTVSAGPCSDGMSDVTYEWTVVRRLGDHRQHGCARVPAP